MISRDPRACAAPLHWSRPLSYGTGQYSEPQYQQRISCDSWEVVVPELVFEPGS